MATANETTNAHNINSIKLITTLLGHVYGGDNPTHNTLSENVSKNFIHIKLSYNVICLQVFLNQLAEIGDKMVSFIGVIQMKALLLTLLAMVIISCGSEAKFHGTEASMNRHKQKCETNELYKIEIDEAVNLMLDGGYVYDEYSIGWYYVEEYKTFSNGYIFVSEEEIREDDFYLCVFI